MMPTRLHTLPLRKAAVIVTVSALLALAGCGDDDVRADGAGPDVTSSSGITSAPSTPPGRWTAYGLPAPGSKGTGITVAREPIRLIHRSRLDALTSAQIDLTMTALEDVYTRAFWSLAELAVGRQTPNMFRRYLGVGANRDFNAQVKKDGRSGFGIFTAKDVSAFYDWRVSDITVDALESYSSAGEASAPVAHLRTTFTTTWTNLPIEYKGKWLTPKNCIRNATTEGWFSDENGDGDVELIGWDTQGPPDPHCEEVPKAN